MSRFKQVVCFLGLLLLSALPALAGNDLQLTILHTNDIHAHLAAFDDFGAFCDEQKDAAGKCQGGVARLATAIARERAKGGNILLLDAGDQFQGTLYFTKYKGEASAFCRATVFKSVSSGTMPAGVSRTLFRTETNSSRSNAFRA